MMNGVRWSYKSCEIRRHFLIIICFAGVGTIAWDPRCPFHSSPVPNCDLHSEGKSSDLRREREREQGIAYSSPDHLFFLLVAVVFKPDG
jgi:hypothetical protein